MAIVSGIGQNLYVAGYDLSNDVGALNALNMTVNLEDITGLDKSAIERQPLLHSGELGFTGWFNDASNQSHDALSTLPTGNIVGALLMGTSVGDRAAGIVGKQVGYAWDRSADGALGIATTIQSDNDFLSWGYSLTAGKENDTTGTNGTGVDFGLGDLSFGATFYLNVFAITGTDLDIHIEESTDDGSGDAYTDVTGGTFTNVPQASAPTSERLQTSLTQTVEDWLRYVSAGTFSSADFSVVAKIYSAANAEL